jgi:hypothetical protein
MHVKQWKLQYRYGGEGGAWQTFKVCKSYPTNAQINSARQKMRMRPGQRNKRIDMRVEIHRKLRG